LLTAFFATAWNIAATRRIGRTKRGTIVTESVGLIVEMIDDQIVVTMPGTLFLAAYRKRDDMAALVARFVQDDRHASMPRAEFVARAWRLALYRAKQLGWIS